MAFGITEALGAASLLGGLFGGSRGARWVIPPQLRPVLKKLISETQGFDMGAYIRNVVAPQTEAAAARAMERAASGTIARYAHGGAVRGDIIDTAMNSAVRGAMANVGEGLAQTLAGLYAQAPQQTFAIRTLPMTAFQGQYQPADASLSQALLSAGFKVFFKNLGI